MAARTIVPNIPNKELEYLLNEIADTATKAEQLCFVTDAEDSDSVQAAFYAMRERIAYMGWIADRIASRAGFGYVKGDASEWLLPPVLRPSEIERAAAPEGEAA